MIPIRIHPPPGLALVLMQKYLGSWSSCTIRFHFPKKVSPPDRDPAYTGVVNLGDAMAVAQLTLEIRIEYAQSLKDRRQVVRSLKDQLKQDFNISVAELDEAVTWQSATIGVVAISRSRDYLRGLIEEVERAARRMINELGAELADSFWEYIESY
jgi:hypothetical protein